MKDLTPNGSEGKTTTDEVSKRLSPSQGVTAPPACFKNTSHSAAIPKWSIWLSRLSGVMSNHTTEIKNQSFASARCWKLWNIYHSHGLVLSHHLQKSKLYLMHVTDSVVFWSNGKWDFARFQGRGDAAALPASCSVIPHPLVMCSILWLVTGGCCASCQISVTTDTVAKLKIRQKVEDDIYGLCRNEEVVPLDQCWTWLELWYRDFLKQSVRSRSLVWRCCKKLNRYEILHCIIFLTL